MIQNTEIVKKLEAKINAIAQEIFDLHEDVYYKRKYVNPEDEHKKDDVYKSAGAYKPQDYYFTGNPSERYWNLFTKLTTKLFEWVTARKGKMYNQSGFGKNDKDFTFPYDVELMNCAKKTIVEYDAQKYPNVSYIAYFSKELKLFVMTEQAREGTEEVTAGVRTTINKTIQNLLQLEKACNVSVEHPKFRATVLSRFGISEKKLDRMLQQYSTNKVVEADATVQGREGDCLQTIGDHIADTYNGINEIIKQSHYANSISLVLDSIETFWEARRSDTKERASLVYTYWFLESVSGSNQKIDYASLAKKYKFMHNQLLSDFMEAKELPAKQDLTKYDAEIISKYSKFEPALLNHLRNDKKLKQFFSLD